MIWRFVLILFLAVATQTTQASIVQPIGNLVTTWNPNLVNQYLEKWDPNIVPGITDPFDTHFAVTEIQPTQPLYFVRVYTGPSDNGAIGTYLVRAQDIRGMTPEQIKNALALPTLPTKITYVKVPPGAQYGLWTGIIGPVNSPGYRWGNGGVPQTKIIGKHTNSNPPADPANFADYSYVPVRNYINPENIGATALSYAPELTYGNARRIAKYLDNHLPQPYSDMEYVYTTLDYVNWMNNTAALSTALNQIGPRDYQALPAVLFRNDINLTNLINNHSINTSSTNHCMNTWGNVSGDQGEQSSALNRLGFTYQTASITIGRDCQIRNTLNVGYVGSYSRSNTSFAFPGGSAVINAAQVGAYTFYSQNNYFLKSSVTGGYNWSSATRNIDITGLGYGLAFDNGNVVLDGVSDILTINRQTHASIGGQDIGAHFLVGKNIPLQQWTLTPTAKVLYFYALQNNFKENGASDLNLHVSDFSAQTLRTDLALQLGHEIHFGEHSIVNGNVLLGWGHNFPLDKRNITASFQSLGDAFTITTYHQQTNVLLTSVGFTTKIDKRLWLDAHYNAELSHGFNAKTIGLVFRYLLDA